jgi:hypothetical protein
MFPPYKNKIAMLVSILCGWILIGCGSGGGSSTATSTSASPVPQAPVVFGPALPPAATPPAGNTMIVADRSGNGVTNYPLQFARPFKLGEIANYPQVLIDGVPVLTQADVKTRFPDGSVKHVILSVVIPQIAAAGSVTLTFQNQASGNNTPLSQAQMLAAGFDFDAKISIVSGGVTKVASARQMLQNGDFTYWTSGPIATTIILADHTALRKYDMGFDSNNSIRPIFHATFWPTVGLVKVRFTGEDSNTTTLQDVNYQLALSTGSASPTTVYSNANLNHYLGTRWTKQFWLSNAPDIRVNVDHNLAYLSQTQSFPNFNMNVRPQLTEAILASNYSNWTGKARDLYDNAFWMKYMPTTGGRPDIGTFPSWALLWVYTGDWRAREVAFGQSDLASAWPLHFREGASSLFMDRAGTVPALGKPISVAAHPTLWLPDNNGNYSIILPTPRILNTSAYPSTSGAWSPDGAHQPDAFSAQYALSGDYYYLEEMQLWAAAMVLSYAPGAYGRGVPGYAGIQDQIRGNGWVLRNRVNAAFFSPDGTPEKAYFISAVEDAVALWEAQHRISATALQSNANWTWSDQNLKMSAVSPLHFWFGNTGGESPAVDGEVNTATALNEESLWMDNYFLICLGAAKEKGFPVGPIFSYLATLVNGQFADPGFDPHYGSAYRTPVQKIDTSYFTSWSEIQQVGYTPSELASIMTSFATSFDGAQLEAAAGSFTAQEPGGAAAWTWLNTNVLPVTDYTAEYLSWALVPRAGGTAPLPAP